MISRERRIFQPHSPSPQSSQPSAPHEHLTTKSTSHRTLPIIYNTYKSPQPSFYPTNPPQPYKVTISPPHSQIQPDLPRLYPFQSDKVQQYKAQRRQRNLGSRLFENSSGSSFSDDDPFGSSHKKESDFSVKEEEPFTFKQLPSEYQQKQIFKPFQQITSREQRPQEMPIAPKKELITSVRQITPPKTIVTTRQSPPMHLTQNYQLSPNIINHSNQNLKHQHSLLIQKYHQQISRQSFFIKQNEKLQFQNNILRQQRQQLRDNENLLERKCVQYESIMKRQIQKARKNVLEECELIMQRFRLQLKSNTF